MQTMDTRLHDYALPLADKASKFTDMHPGQAACQ